MATLEEDVYSDPREVHSERRKAKVPVSDFDNIILELINRKDIKSMDVELIRGGSRLKLEIQFFEEESRKKITSAKSEETTLYDTEQFRRYLTEKEKIFYRNLEMTENDRIISISQVKSFLLNKKNGLMAFSSLLKKSIIEKTKELGNSVNKYGEKILGWIPVLAGILLILFTIFMFDRIGWRGTVENSIGGVIAALISIMLSLLIRKLDSKVSICH